MNAPPYEDSERCMDIRRRSKRGEHISPEELKFCERMLKLFPEWYKETTIVVFEETKPFGSTKKGELT